VRHQRPGGERGQVATPAVPMKASEGSFGSACGRAAAARSVVREKARRRAWAMVLRRSFIFFLRGVGWW
jgi:hypothetical protein